MNDLAVSVLIKREKEKYNEYQNRSKVKYVYWIKQG